MDSIAGTAALIEGVEIVNNARTLTYLKAGYGPANISVTGGCDCPEDWVRQLIDCESLPYENPEFDEAPWYDPAVPESADFAGFLAQEFEGLGSTYKREVHPLIDGGAVLGRLRAEARTLTWRGFLFGRTCCATAYGLRWLTSILRQTICGGECTGERLDILVCCPPAPDEECDNPCQCTGRDLPEPVSPLDDDAFRTLYNVGLLEGPLILDERKSGCGCGCSAIMEVEFSLVAGNPHLWRQPIELANCEEFPPGQRFVKVGSAEECDTPEWASGMFAKVDAIAYNPVRYGISCPDDPVCPIPLSCVENDPVVKCNPPSLPTITTVVDPCVCDPYFPVEALIDIPVSSYGRDFQGVPIFQVYSGSVPLRSTAIRLIENPLGLNCNEVSGDPCNFCNLIRVRWIPAYSRLIIDGVNKRVTIECPGGGIFAGEQYIVGTFEYPILECIPYCVSVTIDSATAADDACFSMFVVPKEM